MKFTLRDNRLTIGGLMVLVALGRLITGCAQFRSRGGPPRGAAVSFHTGGGPLGRSLRDTCLTLRWRRWT